MTNFTIRMSSKQKVYLIRQASQKNTTKAKIIRELINNQIKQQENE
jgi:predicted DNA-binding protein